MDEFIGLVERGFALLLYWFLFVPVAAGLFLAMMLIDPFLTNFRRDKAILDAAEATFMRRLRPYFVGRLGRLLGCRI